MNAAGFYKGIRSLPPSTRFLAATSSFVLEDVIPAEAIAEIAEPAAQAILRRIETFPVVVDESISSAPVPTTYVKFASTAAPATSKTSNAASQGRVSLVDFFTFKPASKVKTEKKPPLLLLHGFDSSVLEFRRIAALLAEGDRDVYILDILGWGFSDTNSVADVKPDAKLAHIKSFIEQVVQQSCVLVGASLGGAIAIILAAETCPELVAKLVLIDAQGFIDSKGPSSLPIVFAKFGVNVLKSTPLRMFANYIAYSDKALATPDAMKIGRLHCLLPSWEKNSVQFVLSGGFVVSDKVPRVVQETLVLWGRNDEILEASFATKFEEILPSGRLQWVEDCGHVPHLEQPAQAARAILEFI